MAIVYAPEPDLSVGEFRQILLASRLAERRRVDDLPRLQRMLKEADLVITAREQGRLVGVSRAITDFSYCCYLSELAVDADFQRQGIGRRLVAETHAAAGEQTSLLLTAAPAAAGYYPHIGMNPVTSGWVIPRKL